MKRILLLGALAALNACASAPVSVEKLAQIESCHIGKVVMIGAEIEQQLQLLTKEHAYVLASSQKELLASLKSKQNERITLCGSVSKGIYDADVLNVERVIIMK
jgi:hypothetical protein